MTDLLAPPDEIALGVAYFDENDPGWIDRIDLDTLSMFNPNRCVLAQVSGRDFDYARLQRNICYERAVEMGLICGSSSCACGSLTAPWRDYITARRAA